MSNWEQTVWFFSKKISFIYLKRAIFQSLQVVSIKKSTLSLQRRSANFAMRSHRQEPPCQAPAVGAPEAPHYSQVSDSSTTSCVTQKPSNWGRTKWIILPFNVAMSTFFAGMKLFSFVEDFKTLLLQTFTFVILLFVILSTDRKKVPAKEPVLTKRSPSWCWRRSFSSCHQPSSFQRPASPNPTQKILFGHGPIAVK